ncbi:hypothetical protein [Pinirhizobacter soli]|uniref:hypothetical protein n=1 Tax=Pinirhizobacter soli TaxID=2786953 RepID=UPI002029E220|nr:hypothetical protein [Pinirhizobacter soli]
MPATGAASPSFNIPSIGQIFHAIPKALVGFLAAFGGVSNACDASARPPGQQHGGGLQTEAHARWQNEWSSGMQACLSEPWVPQFGPDRSIVECALRGISRWQQISADTDDAKVVSRSMARYRPSPAASTLPEPMRHRIRQITVKANQIMRTTDAYARTMEQTESLLWFYSSASRQDLADPGQRYTATRLIELLDDALGLESFMEEACLLSYRLHGLATSAGEQIYRLQPELMRTQEDRAAFARRVNKDFVAADASMNNHQAHTLLRLLATHINEKNSS